jgi:hypothetical protein
MFQNDDFVEVYAKTTGEKQMIPRSWLGQPIGEPFSTVPSARADTVAAILDAVGSDKAGAAAALEAEQAKGDKARSTLVDGLQAVIDAPPTDPPGSSDGTTPADGQKES